MSQALRVYLFYWCTAWEIRKDCLIRMSGLLNLHALGIHLILCQGMGDMLLLEVCLQKIFDDSLHGYSLQTVAYGKDR